MPRTVFAATCLALLVATTAHAADFADSIEKAHNADRYRQHHAVQADLTVQFGGNTLLVGRMLTDTPVGKTRFDLEDGTVLVFDGADAWVAPEDSGFQGARFHVLTWPYFLAAAMKLQDPGADLETLGTLPFKDGTALPAARLTFDAGVGDSPDDWYIVYRDEATDRLAGMAYIVTFGKDLAAAEKEPHAIAYGGWQEVDGVWFSTVWTFYNWSRDEGVVGDPIGEVRLENVQFVQPAEGTFDAPAGAKKAAGPPA